MTHDPRALRAIAGLEAFKGLLATLLVIALAGLPAHDVVQGLAGLTGLVGMLGLHPASLAWPTSPTPIATLTLLATCYAGVRLLEAWGLWRARRWGVWLGATSGAIYLPFELDHILRGPGWLNVSVLAFNVALVGYLTWRLWRQERVEALVLASSR